MARDWKLHLQQALDETGEAQIVLLDKAAVRELQQHVQYLEIRDRKLERLETIAGPALKPTLTQLIAEVRNFLVIIGVGVVPAHVHTRLKQELDKAQDVASLL